MTTATTTTARRVQHNYRYDSTLRSSERVTWQVDELLPESASFDFSRPFLPESLARVQQATMLDARERLLLNQIRGHSYAHMFRVAEAFILPFVMDHARATLGDDNRIRALLGFAGEEAKHRELFERFRDVFERDFGTPCALVGPEEEIAANVLAHPALSIALVTLKLEWMTQRHYLESIADDAALEPRFQSLFRCHWMEEAQHAKLDTLLVEELAARASPAEIRAGIEGLFSIAGSFAELVQRQAELDVESLQRASGRALGKAERDELLAQQVRANRWTFLGSGMSHAKFLEMLAAIDPATRAKVVEITPEFS